MTTIRRAQLMDAPGIAGVHVATWRSAYAGILPEAYLARLSVNRQTGSYLMAMQSGVGVHVALDNDGSPPRVIGFATARRHHPAHTNGAGEIETLYVLDDWRDRGIGRRLVQASARWLAEQGCASMFLWVLRDNPNRWFYARLGGTLASEQAIRVGGQDVIQTAYTWPDIAPLLA